MFEQLLQNYETNANFGGIVTWWDRLFGTYRDQPGGGHEGMVIGCNEVRDPKHLKLHWIRAKPCRPADEEAADGPDRLAPSVRHARAGKSSLK